MSHAVRETAYAKINLALHVRARTPDGYHRIETVFAFAEDGDALTVEPPREAGAIELEVSGPFAGAAGAAADNLVVRAARALAAAYDVRAGARLLLDKRLPVAAGLGGGSADAAAALRLLARWWRLPDNPARLHDIARALGADVPACIASFTVRGDGRGDALSPIDASAVAGWPLLLVNPRVLVPTGPVFAGWSGLDRGALGEALFGRNDLAEPAMRIAPVIREVLERLAGARVAAMSGSGATCFALYADEAERDMAAALIAAAEPGWWVMASRVR